jgi:ANTAR domain
MSVQPDEPDHSDDEPLQAAAVLAVTPVTGVAVSTIGGFLAPETLSATDPVVARIDELQFDLGEGPCWDAVASGRPVSEPALRIAPRHTWPAFSAALARLEVGALFAIPMTVGPLKVGAIDLYDTHPSDPDLTEAIALAAVLGRQVVRRAIRTAASGDRLSLTDRYSRRTIHQATGYVIAQVGVSAEDAELLIRARAFAEGRRMQDVADDILHGRRRFTAAGNVIEEME